MNKLLIVLMGLGIVMSQSTVDRAEANKKFHKEFKKKYGYEWGAYGFNMDSNWETIVDDNQPEREDSMDGDSNEDAEKGI